MQRLLLNLFILLVFVSCKRAIDYSNLQAEAFASEEFGPYAMFIYDFHDADIFRDYSGDYPDGDYSAEVEYYTNT